jgi:molybdenum cofactor synthesis domain-containing protein
MKPLVAETAAIALVGAELLSGKVADLNLVELARTLRALGVRLSRAVMLPDVLDVLAADIQELKASHDVVFTSGGVGPTHDDVTVEAVARAFNTTVVEDATLAALVTRAYGSRTTPSHLRMALVPEGSVLATSPDGAWPTPVMGNVWMLPGVPEVFREKLATVRHWVRGPRPFVSRAVFTKMEEADVKLLLDAVVAAHADVEVGSYPRWFEPSYRTKVTFDGADQASVDQALQAFASGLPAGTLVRVE